MRPLQRNQARAAIALRVVVSVPILVDAHPGALGSPSTDAERGVEAMTRMTDVQNETQQAQDLPEIPAPVTLTDKAVEMVKEAMAQEKLEGHALRVGVTGGGCSGLQYMLDFSEQASEDDLVHDQGGIKLFVDPFSAAHLSGTVIDYVDDLNGSGFKFDNPHIVRSCGCGSSFQQ
jgi:iron-sulfur cluster assembly accessory protein